MQPASGFWRVLLSFWAALLCCVVYIALAYLLIRFRVGSNEASGVVELFVSGYGGLIAGTACITLFLMSIFVLRVVPQLIEDAIPDLEIEQTRYHFWKRRLESKILGISQFTTYFAAGYAIYSLLGFPVAKGAQPLLVIFTGIQYGCGGFVGRKLWCVSHMLRSLEGVKPKDNLLETESLPRLIYVVNIFTFLTLVMTAVHTYFLSRIEYSTQGDLTTAIHSLVYLPMVLAMPVVILFNFYPRMVVNRLYLKSIRQRKDWLAEKMLESSESEVSKIKHTIDYEKYLNEEFRYRQRVALSELPVALSITLAIIVATIRFLAKQ